MEVTRYTISRGGVPLAIVNGTVTSFSDRSVVQSTAYSYSVTASDAAGNVSVASNTSSATTPSYVPFPDSTPPSVPTGVKAEAGTGNSSPVASVIVKWLGSTDNTAVTSYTVLRDGVVHATVDATGGADTFIEFTRRPRPRRHTSMRSGRTMLPARCRRHRPPSWSHAGLLHDHPSPHRRCPEFRVPGEDGVGALYPTPRDGERRRGTYITGPSGKAGFAIVRVSPVIPLNPPTVTLVVIRYGARQFLTSGSTGTVTVRAELYKGTTLIGTGATRTLGNGYATFTDAFSISPAATLPDLRVKLTQISASNKAASRFSWVEVAQTGTPSDTTAPTKPLGLEAYVVSDRRIDLSWGPSTDANGVQGYLLFRDGVKIVSTIGGTTYKDVGRNPGTTYRLRG